ncbi:unnamed protein product [Peniophora sp. CBMAI 1063]|nr:unnamed protein product [Peniophora sp. CBMAI 1063]
MLPHAFVTARLLPGPSLSKTSPYGAYVAGTVQTRPFTALRIHLHPETGFYPSSPPLKPKGLFIVSQQKPRPPFEDFYVPLTPGGCKEPLRLNRPLPQDVTDLYVHTYPLMREQCEWNDDSANDPIEPSFYQLDDESYRRLIAFYRDHHPSEAYARYCGDISQTAAHVQWDTFSGQHRYEMREPDTSFAFEISPLDRDELFISEADVWSELVSLVRLRYEYSWKGVTRAINWMCDVRRWEGAFALYTSYVREEEGSESAPHADERYRELCRLKALVDAEEEEDLSRTVDSESDDSESDSDDDDGWLPATPKFTRVRPAPRVMPSENTVRAIVFDVCGAILDFITPAQNALTQLGVPQTSVGYWTTRLRELQALEHVSQKAAYLDVSRRALQSITRALSFAVPSERFEEALQTLVTPLFVPGIQDALEGLSRSGFATFGYSTLDERAYEAFVLPLLSDLPLRIIPPFDDPPGLFSPCTTSHMHSILTDIRRGRADDLPTDQILVVSPSSVRALEPAAAAGLSTALLSPSLPGNTRHPEVDALWQHTSVEATMVVGPDDMVEVVSMPGKWKTSEVWVRGSARRVRGMYEILDELQPWSRPGGATVCAGIAYLTNEPVVIKYDMPQSDGDPTPVRIEACVYAHLSDCPAVPRVHWAGSEGGGEVLVIDHLGPTLEDLRSICRGTLSYECVLLIGVQLLEFIECAHRRGIVLRDIKPHNAAVGRTPDRASTIYNFDFGNARGYIDPGTGAHVPLRTGRTIVGTARFCSHWSHRGLECSRRDDIVSLGHTLLYLYYGYLPWQGVHAPTREDKIRIIGEMKAPSHPSMLEFLADAPDELSALMEHAYGLEFEQEPDYKALRGAFEGELASRGLGSDALCDWVWPELGSWIGTLVPWEYQFWLTTDVGPPSAGPYLNSAGERWPYR